MNQEFTPSTLYSGKFLTFVKEGHWEYATRLNATGAAVIVAVNEEQKLLLVEQYRIPVHTRTIELPAGIIGDEPDSANESNADAARRELLEETGYAAARMKALMTGPSGAGLTSERVTFFLASGLSRMGKGGGVAHEDIVVHEVPLAEAPAWLEAKGRIGFLIDPKIYAGLFFIAQNIRAV